MLAYSPLHIMLAYLHLHTLTLAYFALGCFRSSSVCVCVSTPVSKDTTLAFSNLHYELVCTEAGGQPHGCSWLSNEEGCIPWLI